MDEKSSFNVCIVCLVTMFIFGFTYLFLNPNSILDFSSPLLWITFISAGIGIIICTKEIINDIMENKRIERIEG